ncbi:hypothetical protein L6452_31070 [Arctium lappa]|uniref:Uncharacterized protein n=1 Tax=Arctium lappa TaxID=4217 RepID=A0ACB8ZK20_ARCLA|nr:hypothetical protein L6452_31070 [Arctium lappa]
MTRGRLPGGGDSPVVGKREGMPQLENSLISHNSSGHAFSSDLGIKQNGCLTRDQDSLQLVPIAEPTLGGQLACAWAVSPWLGAHRGVVARLSRPGILHLAFMISTFNCAPERRSLCFVDKARSVLYLRARVVLAPK